MAYIGINIRHPCLLIKILLIIYGVNAKGTAELKLLNFSNPSGNNIEGDCCDFKSFWSSQCVECDHMFKICIGNITQSSSMNECEFGQQTTGSVKKNEFQFTSDIGGTENPLRFSFYTWPKVMKIKIDAQDKDGSDKFDFIDHYEYPIFLNKLTNQKEATTQKQQLIGAISELVLEITVYCDDGYYGAVCNVYCEESDDDVGGHFTCDKESGKKICHKGWSGEKCNADAADDCLGNRCALGSTCEDNIGFYRCRCPTGVTGQFCDGEINECATSPCLNGGTCLDGRASFSCFCVGNYTGDLCERKISACDSTPCLNQGSCTIGNDTSSYTCECKEGYTGRVCENTLDNCQLNNCTNNSTCITVNTTYICGCVPGTSGSRCEIDINECYSSPCLNGGTCIDNLNAFLCSCRIGTRGKFCQETDTSTTVIDRTEHDINHHYITTSNSREIKSPIYSPESILIPNTTLADQYTSHQYTSDKTTINVTQNIYSNAPSMSFSVMNNITSSLGTSKPYDITGSITGSKQNINRSILNGIMSTPSITDFSEKPRIVTDCLVIKVFRSNKLDSTLERISKSTICWPVYDSILPPISKVGTQYIEQQREAYTWLQDTLTDLLPLPSKSTAKIINRNKILSALRNIILLVDNSESIFSNMANKTSPCVQIWMKPKRRLIDYLKTQLGDPNIEYRSKSNVERRFLSSKMTYCQQNNTIISTTLGRTSLNPAKVISTMSERTLMTNKSTRVPTTFETTSGKNKSTYFRTPSKLISIVTIRPSTRSDFSNNMSTSISKSSATNTVKKTTTARVRLFNIILHKLNKTHYQERISTKIHRPDNKPRMVLTVIRTARRIYHIGSESARKVYKKSKLLLHMTLKQLSTIWISVRKIKNFAVQPITKGQEAIRKTWSDSWLKVNNAFSKTRQLLQDAYSLAKTNFINTYHRLRNTSAKLARDYYQRYYSYYNKYNKRINRVSGYFSNMYKNYTNNLHQYWAKHIRFNQG
ncbi:uncharacterized protein LOC115218507 [Argonauta hians]